MISLFTALIAITNRLRNSGLVCLAESLLPLVPDGKGRCSRMVITVQGLACLWDELVKGSNLRCNKLFKGHSTTLFKGPSLRYNEFSKVLTYVLLWHELVKGSNLRYNESFKCHTLC